MAADGVQLVDNLFLEVKVDLLAADVNDVKVSRRRHFAGRRCIASASELRDCDGDRLDGQNLFDCGHCNFADGVSR